MLAISFTLFLLDRLLKIIAFKAPEGGVFLISKFLRFELHKNFGIIANLPLPRLLVIVLSIIFIAFFIWIGAPAKKSRIKFAAGLVIAGATSNLIDRLTYGFVVDYISILGISFTNLADLMIWLGIIILLLTPKA